MDWPSLLVLAALVVAALLRAVFGQFDADAPGTDIPSLPNFFSAYTESILNVDGFPLTVNLSHSFYDIDTRLARADVAGESIGLDKGPVSLIQAIDVGVTYTIYKQHSNCTVAPLIAGADLRLGPDGHYHLRNVNDLLLLSGVNYTYAGNMSAHGLILDNWKFTGNFSHAGVNYTNSSVQLSITRSGQTISNSHFVTTSSLPWRFSMDASVILTSLNETYTTSFSTVSRYFDLSFTEPNLDVFDVSVCADPKDTISLTLAVPGVKNGLDLGQFKGNVKKSVSNYTQLYPVQVGNVQITKENSTFLFVSLQISNLTAMANVSNRVTAKEAYNDITSSKMADGQAPFQIELKSGVWVTPYIIDPNKAQDCENTSVPVTPTQCPSMESIVMPSPSVTTITVTVTPSVHCSPTPTSPPTCPPKSVGVSQSHVVGIAFGTLITGSFISCVSIVVCFVCYQKTRTRKWSPSTVGYQKAPDSVTEKEYFQ